MNEENKPLVFFIAALLYATSPSRAAIESPTNKRDAARAAAFDEARQLVEDAEQRGLLSPTA